MESNIIYKNNSYELIEDFIDVGYMAENVELQTLAGDNFLVKRSHSDGAMTLLVSFPFVKEFEEQILKLDHFMSSIQVPIFCYFVFSSDTDGLEDLQTKLKKFEILKDSEDEFGPMYGTKFVDKELEDKLTKALFLISKDGAVFYLDMPQNLEDELKLDRLQVELNKAYVTYTGVGCHG